MSDTTSEVNRKKFEKIERQTNFKWAEAILARVNEGDKVPFGDIERAHEIIRGMIGGDEDEKPAVKARWVKNITELAAEMGVTRRTITNWRKRPGCPKPASDGRWNITEWTIWAADEGVGQIETDEEAESIRSELMLENWRLRNDRLRLDLECARGNYSSNEDVSRMVRRMVANSRRVLAALPAVLAPQVIGMTIAAAETRIKEEVEGAMRQLSEGDWQ